MWWIWMCCAGLFLFGEILLKKSWFIWLSFGAALSGILALLHITIPGQIAVFINISGILIVIERRFFERYTFKKPIKNLKKVKNATVSVHSDEPQNIFRQLGVGWEIRYQGTFYTLKPSIGLVHIKNLIMHQGEWLHCSELKRISQECISDIKFKPYNRMTNMQLEEENMNKTESALDEKIISRLSLKNILNLREQITEKIESEEYFNPEEIIDQRAKRDQLDKYLNSITDKKGKIRKLDNKTEKERKAVSAAINRCRNSFLKYKDLHIHFISFISAKNSSFCYLPDRPIAWKTE